MHGVVLNDRIPTFSGLKQIPTYLVTSLQLTSFHTVLCNKPSCLQFLININELMELNVSNLLPEAHVQHRLLIFCFTFHLSGDFVGMHMRQVYNATFGMVNVWVWEGSKNSKMGFY